MGIAEHAPSADTPVGGSRSDGQLLPVYFLADQDLIRGCMSAEELSITRPFHLAALRPGKSNEALIAQGLRRRVLGSPYDQVQETNLRTTGVPWEPMQLLDHRSSRSF